ncbi:ABC transporter permease [Nibrella saemangeumensis]|uniref:ABC transporter permease n=1 Tax=Nibrella saemangeumensis TaxID=1084526 RepID=A0ABP8MLN2_9BACT
MLHNYLKIAFRNLWKNRTFSLINVFGLAVGLTVCLLIGLFIADELSYDRYHTNAHRIVRVVNHFQWEGNQIDAASTSGPYAPTLKAEFPEVEQAVRILSEGGEYLKASGEPVKSVVVYADSGFFEMFSYPFLAGDPARALDAPNSMVLTRSVAESLYGDAAKAYGQTIHIQNSPDYLITGVISDPPRQSHFQFGAVGSLNTSAGFLKEWQNFSLYTYLLLREGYDPARLQAKMPAFYQKHLNMMGVTAHLELQRLTSIHLHSHLVNELSANADVRYLYLFAAVGAIILLLAGINYVNLTTAQSAMRAREIGIRKVVGSQRSQLVAQFLTESLLLAALAQVVCVQLLELALPLVNQLTGKSLQGVVEGNTLLIGGLIGLTLLTGLLSGLYPAFVLSGFAPVRVLKSRFGASAGRGTFRKTLVVAQFSVSIALIAATLVVYAQMQFVSTRSLGFTNAPVVGVRVPDYAMRNRVDAFKTQLLRNPNILQASATTNPLGKDDLGMGGVFLERNNQKPSRTDMTHILGIDPAYVSTMQLRLTAGRDFRAGNGADSLRSVLVNETLVRKAGWQNPIGRRIWFLPADEKAPLPKPVEVVGVVADFHVASLHQPIEPVILTPIRKAESDNLFLRLRPDNLPATLAYIQQVFKEFDPINVCETYFLDQNYARQYESDQRRGQLFLASAGLAIFIACLGLFGLATFTAQRRTKEIGIRKVLGASVPSLVSMLSADFLKLVLIALLIATPIAWYTMNRWLQDFAYKISIEWWMFALAGLLAITIALITVSFQSVKAALANPVKSLRAE